MLQAIDGFREPHRAIKGGAKRAKVILLLAVRRPVHGALRQANCLKFDHGLGADGRVGAKRMVPSDQREAVVG
jgi:hypothetical protein